MRRQPSPPRAARRWPILPLILAALGLAQVGALWGLNYSQAWISNVGVAAARLPRDPMKLGGLRWDPAPYVAAPSLAPLRALVQEHCPHLDAVATANCLGDLLGQRFAHGAPRIEFFAAGYDPVSALDEHLAGQPGHCVTRSGLLAAALLASGFPARVVQLMPADSNGHNVVEAWDPARGWTMIDPTYRLEVETAGRPSAAAALAAPDAAHWRVNERLRPVTNLRDVSRPELLATARRWSSGYLVYPDPWLYTRVGKKSAPPPFQGRFVLVGPRTLRVGIAQPLLQGGILLCLATLVVSLFGGSRAEEPGADVVMLTVGQGPVLPRPEVIAAENRARVAAGGRSADA